MPSSEILMEESPCHSSVKLCKQKSETLSKIIAEAVEEAVSKTKEKYDGEIATLKSTVRSLEKQVNALEQYDRRLNLVIHGIKESDGEDCDKLALNLFLNKVKVPMSATDIQRSHRLGAPRRNGQSRPIIVRFVSYKTRREVLVRKKILKESDPHVTITENLTRANLELFHLARNSGFFERVWTRDGSIFALSNRGVVKISSPEDMDRYSSK